MMMMLRRQLRVKAKIASMRNTLPRQPSFLREGGGEEQHAEHPGGVKDSGPASLLKVGDRLAVNLAGGLFSQILYEEDLRQDW
ncbi:unnamed protein product [Sphagnum jensenii]|uniref:Uncharacterized protein n=1 Tax=Sphagnum jensenii TaxID=128206 RepID=A0ABP0WRR9_9BRYO